MSFMMANQSESHTTYKYKCTNKSISGEDNCFQFPLVSRPKNYMIRKTTAGNELRPIFKTQSYLEITLKS